MKCKVMIFIVAVIKTNRTTPIRLIKNNMSINVIGKRKIPPKIAK
jgi:hypothetical protein